MNVFYKLLQIGLSGSFAILYLLILRIVLRKLPKRVTYVLWGLAAFHLIGIAAPVGKFAFIPKVKIAGKLIYMNVNWEAMAIIYLLGLCIILLVNMVNYLQLKGRLKRSVSRMVLADDVQCKFGRTNLPIYRCIHISSAFTFGYFPPRIYLPEGLDKSMEEMIILHEKTHIRRGDYLIKLMAFLLCAVNWYNPLVWCAFYFFVRDQETSCDEIVLQKIGETGKKQYADTILRAASGFFVSDERNHALAFGEANIKYRIRHCLKDSYFTRNAYVFAVLGTTLFMLWGLFVSEKLEISTIPVDRKAELSTESGGIIDGETGIIYEMRGDGIYSIDEGVEKLIYKDRYHEITDFYLYSGALYFVAENGICIKRLDVNNYSLEEIFCGENGKRVSSFNIEGGILEVTYTDDSTESRKLSCRVQSDVTAQEILAHPGTFYNVTNWNETGAYTYMDMDGDGKDEEIRLDFSLEDMNQNGQTTYILSVDQSLAQGCVERIANEIYGISLDGENILLALRYTVLQEADSPNQKTSFYRYEGGSVTACGEVDSDIYTIKISNNTITSYVREEILLAERVKITWHMNEEGILVRQEKEYDEIDPVHYKIVKDISVHEEPESDITYALRSQMVTVNRVTKKGKWQVGAEEFEGRWVELICYEGRTGWVFVSNGTLPETGESTDEVFKMEMQVTTHSLK